MRLIDADKLIEQLREVNDEIVKGCIGVIQTQPTAYDVEAKVAELRKLNSETEYCWMCGGGIDARKAISIVRGKE